MQRLGIAGIAAYTLLDTESLCACSTLCKVPVLMKGTCSDAKVKQETMYMMCNVHA